MRRTDSLLLALGCAAVCQSSHASAEDDTACLREPWAVREVSVEDGARLISGTGGECLERVARMTGEATLFEKRPGWSPGQVALAQHASGYYLRLTYKVPDEWSWYGVEPGDPLIMRLEDGTELAFFPACASQVSSPVFTGYFDASRDQLEQLSLRRVTSVKQFMTSPADAESEYLEQTYGGQSYFVLRSEKEPPAASLQSLARCMLQAGEVDAAAIVVPPVPQEPATTEKGPYSKKVQGKLWLEGFIGPSSYDLDRFGYEFRSAFGSASTDLDLLPKVKGPEFGGAIGGTLFDQIFWIGASYRQANLEVGEGLGGFKLMKTGLEMQVVITPAPYVHPLVRVGVGYARVFGGNAAAAGLTFNGFYVIAGVGIRVPIVRWVSVFGTFDWNYTEVSPKGLEVEGNLYARGSQLGGTFGLTLHFVGVR